MSDVENTVQNAPEDAAATVPAEPQVTELDGLSEFRWQGESYTPDRLHQIFNEHKTFGQEAKTYKQEKEFIDNLATDIENVLERPDLIPKFKAIYPQKYHAILDKYLSTQGKTSAPSQNSQPSLPKEFLNDFNQVKERLNFHEQRAFNAEVEAANARLDATLPPLFKKYEMAVEDQVYSKAEAILQSGQKLTEKTWERLIRESHDAAQKRADRIYGEKLKTQIEKGAKGADTPTGGGVPGQAPKKPRTFQEAQEAMIQSLQRQK